MKKFKRLLTMLSMLLCFSMMLGMGTVSATNEKDSLEKSDDSLTVNERLIVTFCTGVEDRVTNSKNIFTGVTTYKTYKWHSKSDDMHITPNVGTHLCITDKFDKNSIWLSGEVNCPYGGGGGEARIPVDY